MRLTTLAVPEGYQVVGYRRSRYIRDGFDRLVGNVIEVADDELVVEKTGNLFEGVGGLFNLGYLLPEEDRLILRQVEAFVQVELIGSGSYRWTYRDPSRALIVGDLVEVPHGATNHAWTAKVVALGRGNWDGATKDITARIKREVLSR